MQRGIIRLFLYGNIQFSPFILGGNFSSTSIAADGYRWLLNWKVHEMQFKQIKLFYNSDYLLL